MLAVLPQKGVWRVFRVESTVMTRFWLALHTLVLALQLAFGRPGAFSVLRRGDRYLFVPEEVWIGLAFALSALMMWRTFGYRPRPLIAWFGNAAVAALWGSVVIGRLVADGLPSLASGATATWLMAVWVLLRTEANYHDSETA